MNEVDIETTKEIICITACEYPLSDSEWIISLQSLLGDNEMTPYLSEAALAFIEDVSIWAHNENIGSDILCAAIRRIYEE